MQAEINTARLACFDHFAFRHRKLIEFQHPYFTQLFLNKLPKGKQIDADRKAGNHRLALAPGERNWCHGSTRLTNNER